MEQDIKGVIFRIGQEEYVIPITQVVSIERMQKETKLPQMPSHFKGVVELRGLVIPLVDLREVLDRDNPQNHDLTRIIVVRVEEKQVGIIVDAATDVLDIPKESIQDSKITLCERNSFLTGITKMGNRLLILLDIKELLRSVSSLDLLKDIKDQFVIGGKL